MESPDTPPEFVPVFPSEPVEVEVGLALVPVFVPDPDPDSDPTPPAEVLLVSKCDLEMGGVIASPAAELVAKAIELELLAAIDDDTEAIDDATAREEEAADETERKEESAAWRDEADEERTKAVCSGTSLENIPVIGGVDENGAVVDDSVMAGSSGVVELEVVITTAVSPPPREKTDSAVVEVVVVGTEYRIIKVSLEVCGWQEK